jgi:hypothetical protein
MDTLLVWTGLMIAFSIATVLWGAEDRPGFLDPNRPHRPNW